VALSCYLDKGKILSIDINSNFIDIMDSLYTLSKKELQNIIKQIDIQTAKKDKNKTYIINYIIIMYIKDNKKALSTIKREKIFSLDINSKNKFTINILDFILKNNNLVELVQNDIEYFQSKKNLSLVSEYIYEISQEIRKKIKNYGKSFVRDILYITDMHFYKTMHNIASISIPFQTLSEIASFLIYLYSSINKEHIISQKTFAHTIEYKKLDDLITLSFKVRNFQDIEKLIDNFDYKCSKEKNNLIIKDKDKLLEKSRKYGDFHSDMQRRSLEIAIKEKYKNALSFNEFIKKISKNTEILFEFKEQPIERYIFNFPIFGKINEFILKDQYFIEEIFELEEIKKEYGIEDIMSFKISQTLTIKDLMIVKRVYKIMGLLNSNFLYAMLEQDDLKKQVIYNSWIKAFKIENLKSTLIPYIGNKKADEFISEFSWSLESKIKLDLQYTPLIKYKDYYLPMNIFIGSNLFRNILFKNKIRPHNSSAKDTISENIENVLKKDFTDVAREIKFKKNGYEGDFDVIAHIDNVIYIFECKNTITPTDLHELRTTYKDNILHGFEQLSKCKNVLLSDGYIKDLNNNLKWNISSDFKIVTCVVLSTRMFNGYTNGEHHVRSFHELFNFIDTGKIEITDNGVTKEIRLWKNNKITGNDLYDFIENRIIHKPILESFDIKINKELFGTYSVSFETYEFNPKKFYENMYYLDNKT
jgi:hypothetical protein